MLNLNLSFGFKLNISKLKSLRSKNDRFFTTATRRLLMSSTINENNQFIYKFISSKPNSLKDGTLYVADTINGKWISLDYDSQPKLKEKFKDQTEVLIRVREAAILGIDPNKALREIDTSDVDKIVEDIESGRARGYTPEEMAEGQQRIRDAGRGKKRIVKIRKKRILGAGPVVGSLDQLATLSPAEREIEIRRFKDSVLERKLRDSHACATHRWVAHPLYEDLGKIFLGVEASPEFTGED